MVNVKILGISTSVRHANTEIAVKWAMESAAELPGVETEFVSLAGKTIYPCNNCYRCLNSEADNPCPAYDDDFREICLKMIEPDGIIVGANVDFQTAGVLFHIFKSRLMSLEMNRKVGPEALRNKVFGCIAVGGSPYNGINTAQQYMIMWAIQNDMHVVGCGPDKGITCGGFLGAGGATFLVKGCARIFRGRGPLLPNTPAEKEAIKEDEACFLQCQALGKRVAETAKVIKAGFDTVPPEEMHWQKGPVKIGGYDFGQKQR
ncbi:MAG: flavodoxin family protein [Chloroflexi bacterium]|nr:flavodoxin family protein [Chloroflexota bacterium]